jgi:hypothetical protein
MGQSVGGNARKIPRCSVITSGLQRKFGYHFEQDEVVEQV